jgi:hypothetical protein
LDAIVSWRAEPSTQPVQLALVELNQNAIALLASAPLTVNPHDLVGRFAAVPAAAAMLATRLDRLHRSRRGGRGRAAVTDRFLPADAAAVRANERIIARLEVAKPWHAHGSSTVAIAS